MSRQSESWCVAVSLTCVLLFPGCGQPPQGGSLSAQEEALRTSDLVVTRVDRFHLERGEVVRRSTSLDGTTINAFVPGPDGGSLLTGVHQPDGTVTIPGVPRGEYWLQVGATWVLTSERRIDLAQDVLGRPGVELGSPGTALVVDAPGLEATTAGDDLQLVSANASIGFYSTLGRQNPITANAPAPGDTALLGARFPFDRDPVARTVAFPLVQASQGDVLTLTQAVPRTTSDGVPYLAVARALTARVEMAQGAATPLAGVFQPLRERHLELDARADLFEAMSAEVGPGATTLSTGLFLDASPVEARQVSATPDLVQLSLAAGGGARRLELVHGDPFPTEWTRFVLASVLVQVPYLAPGATPGTTLTRNTFVTNPALRPVHDGRLDLTPVVSPPRRLAVDGVDSNAAGLIPTSTTPVVSWERPAVGRARQYRVRIDQLNPAAPLRVRIATLRVDAGRSSVRIPAGLLVPGRAYGFVVSAISPAEDIDPAYPDLALALPLGITAAYSPGVLAN